MKLRLLLILLLNFSIPVYAKDSTLVLIHGYLADGGAWRTLDIVRTLQWSGWEDGGHLFPEGPLFKPKLFNPEHDYLYTVTLPSEAPLPYQAVWLERYLNVLYEKHRNNQFILVGHSAGGVVARLVMLRYRFPIKTLISIASPHLGTVKAEDALDLSNSPFSWIAPFMGLDTINRSEQLYTDLVREFPATPLFAVNRSKHPTANYISVIRRFDSIVPPYSQNMNNIAALAGKSKVITSFAGHGLIPEDGVFLANLLTAYQ